MESLLLDADLQDLASSTRSMLQSVCPISRVREVSESDDALDGTLWSRLANDLGVQGLLVDEKYSGSDAGLKAAAVVAIEIGAALVPGPILPTMMSGHALRVASATAAADVSEGIADGSIMAALLLPSQHAVRVHRSPSGDARLTGTSPLVQSGRSLDVVLLVAEFDEGLVLAVARRGDGWSHPPVSSVDLTRRYDSLDLRDAEAQLFDLTSEDVVRLEAAVATVTAAGQHGVMRRTVDETVSYCSNRIAFGRVVGSFQAMKHQLAELTCVVAQSDGLLSAAAASEYLPSDDFAAAAWSSLCWSGPRSADVSSECLRLLGGIGYTWEHDAHLFFRRSRVDEHHLGHPLEHRRRLARLLGLIAE
jgi:alkylation response protein AidB-like acyl-CoA dehydrogenase